MSRVISTGRRRGPFSLLAVGTAILGIGLIALGLYLVVVLHVRHTWPLALVVTLLIALTGFFSAVAGRRARSSSR